MFGYTIGYSSPVINELEEKRDNQTKDGYLEKNEYQGVFSVRKFIVMYSDYMMYRVIRRLCQLEL